MLGLGETKIINCFWFFIYYLIIEDQSCKEF